MQEWPYFRRAREYHLYDDKGNRYLDLWQNDGRAIMGHRPGKFSQYFKNSISRGMWADYPNPKQKSLANLLKKLFPDYEQVRIFRNRERAITHLGIETPLDPLNNVKSTALDWRPCMPQHPTAEMLFLRLPLAGMLETQIVLSTAEMPQGDNISPIIAEGLIRLFHDFSNWQNTNPQWRKLKETSAGTQNGPYFSWATPTLNYDNFWQQSLKKGILLPPESKYPLMIPQEMSDYEYKIICTILEETLSKPN